MQNFQEMIVDCHLFDLGYSSPTYTWCNKKEGLEFIQERLDRALANDQCQILYI
jgi:hypothetical protein